MRRLSVWNPWGMTPRWMDWDEDDLIEMSDVSMDVYEEGDSVVVKIVVPGFKKDQLDISVESGKIVVTGKSEEKLEESSKKRKYYRKEIATKSFTRSCALPVDVVPSKAQAKFEDGILTISLPKTEESKPQKIQLSVN